MLRNENKFLLLVLTCPDQILPCVHKCVCEYYTHTSNRLQSFVGGQPCQICFMKIISLSSPSHYLLLSSDEIKHYPIIWRRPLSCLNPPAAAKISPNTYTHSLNTCCKHTHTRKEAKNHTSPTSQPPPPSPSLSLSLFLLWQLHVILTALYETWYS